MTGSLAAWTHPDVGTVADREATRIKHARKSLRTVLDLILGVLCIVDHAVGTHGVQQRKAAGAKRPQPFTGTVERRRPFELADAVIHLAAIPAPGLAPDVTIFQHNMMTTYNVFSAATLLGLGRVVWASSETTFGLPFTRVTPSFAPLTEEHPLLPENSYALAVQRSRAEQWRVQGIGELARISGGLVMGADYEFFARPEWAALQRAYGIDFRERRSMDPALMYQALASGAVDVISAFSTDGRIAAYDLVVLRDERGAIPPYDALLLVGRRLSQQQPAALAALAQLSGWIDSERMRRANEACG